MSKFRITPCGRQLVRAVLATAALINLLVACACGGSGVPSESVSAPLPVTLPSPLAQAPNPLRIAFMQDQTLSTGWTRTPQLTLADFEPFRGAFRRSGG